MTKEKQIEALAKLDGLKYTEAIYNNYVCVRCGGWDGDINYLESYDAIIPLIQKQDDRTKRLIHKHIGTTIIWEFDATPSKLSEALLRAHGLWEE